MDTHCYGSPLVTRYSSAEMLHNWSDQKRVSTWRRLWLYLAKAEKKLGIEAIGDDAISEIEANLENIDFELARNKEKELRHDVMAHLHTLAEVAPSSKAILHLGATSCYVTDNSELILIRDAFDLLTRKLAKVCYLLRSLCLTYKDLPTLGFTHFQPAQLTTVGKRACMWLQDLICDLESFLSLKKTLKFRGVKGTTGTQASFLALFGNDHNKVDELDRMVTEMAGFELSYGVTGQTYPRKTDVAILNALASFGASTHKIATDLRLLSGLKEMEEPFEKHQIGSSAMPYKRNPMRSERVCSLSRHIISLSLNASMTCATQWLERTLDDSANRRISIPESFLTADAVINTLGGIFDNIVVYPKVIEARVMQELPFMATENILMEMANNGGDRQECHERIRQHSVQVSKSIKCYGDPNNLIDRIRNDPYFERIKDNISDIVAPKKFIGCAPHQVERFVSMEVDPVLEQFSGVEVSFSNKYKSEV